MDSADASGPLWVKTGKAHNEQNISGLPPIADIARQFLEQVGGRPVG
jgi:hypothetical protein